MKMKNKTTKLRTHTSSKKGRKFQKEQEGCLENICSGVSNGLLGSYISRNFQPLSLVFMMMSL